jgi:uncharacterized membrane protein YfcA
MPLFDPQQLRIFGRVGAVGAEMVGATLLGYFGGRWLGGWLGAPWLAWVGLVLGIVTGFYELFRVARQLQRELDKEQD